jgi:hypothetical protein
LVLHTDDNHPHVHVVVKAVSEQGTRLNIFRGGFYSSHTLKILEDQERRPVVPDGFLRERVEGERAAANGKESWACRWPRSNREGIAIRASPKM